MTINKEKLQLLADMNCASLTLSMECGNDYYRQTILKRHYSDDGFIKAIKYLNEVGLRSAVLTMIGLPFESRKMIFQTINLGRKSKAAHVNTNIFFPYFGTPLGDMAAKYKLCDEKKVRSSKFDASRTLLNMPQIEPWEVEAIRKMWSFYMTWPRIMYPIFRWLEKDTIIRRNVLKIFQSIEYGLKGISHNRDKRSRRTLDLIAKSIRREFPGNPGKEAVLQKIGDTAENKIKDAAHEDLFNYA
jgi:radical SAM superfamily enzyme YgiQ (UPF0313 family)